jgi:hypothetical protein
MAASSLTQSLGGAVVKVAFGLSLAGFWRPCERRESADCVEKVGE